MLAFMTYDEGDLGPVRGVVTATKAYPEAPYSERFCLYLFFILI